MSPAETLIRNEIRQCGAIPFARFMELALYSPKIGYYETHAKTIGRKGDYFTSVSVGEVFGQLLARRIVDWMRELDPALQQPFSILEAGAHDGRLAHDILQWMEANRPEALKSLRYGLLEPSTRRRQWQAETLLPYALQVEWFQDWKEVPVFNGLCLCNELLDAFPFRRFTWRKSESGWYEQFVAVSEDSLRMVSQRAEDTLSGCDLRNAGYPLSDEMMKVLPDGYVLEDAKSARAWWAMAASRLGKGRLLAIDYGATAAELLRPERSDGTARAYFEHRVSDDLLSRPGEQDLTAHVNFTGIQTEGEAQGLTTRTYTHQGQFLTEILADALVHQQDLGWTPKQRSQFQTLVHPEHLGRLFKVLIQSRAV
jgi:SAM-dependent MidA family methyltransferase